MTLDRLQKEWIRSHDRFRKDCPVRFSDVAAPFVSVGDPDVSGNSSPTILFVGKATGGDWFSGRYAQKVSMPLSDRLAERRETTSRFLTARRYAHNRATGFWRMLQALKEDTRGTVIWSNVTKIGTRRGNPPPALVEVEADLAIATLRAEVEDYDPQLIIFVTGYFARFEVVAPFLHVRKRTDHDSHWIFHCRRRAPGKPAALWTGHPQGKSRDVVDLWLKEARRLLS